jgi:hypothetical protein
MNKTNTGMVIHVGRWQKKIFKRIKKKKRKTRFLNLGLHQRFGDH